MSDQRYFDLTIPAPRRLALMRQAFANHATKYPHCPEHVKPKTWRDVRAYTLNSWRAAFCAGLNPGFNGDTPVWYSHNDGPQFRDERLATDILGSDHTGYYTDTDYSETARGIVARLTHGRFIAGYEWSSNGERVYFAEVFDDEREAARSADRQAEIFADQSREDSAKYYAARDLETSIEDALHRLRECMALRHKKCMTYVRDEITEICATIRECRETLRTEYSDYL